MQKPKTRDGLRFDSTLLHEEPGMRWQKVVISIILLFTIAFIYWTTQTRLDEVTIAQGQILPTKDIYQIQAPYGGRISKVPVKNGEYVKQGTIIAVIDDRSFQDEKDRLALQLSTLRSRKAVFDEQYRTREKLAQEGLNSRMSLLSMNIERTLLKGQIDELEQKIKHVEKQSKDLTVLAPVDGWIHNFKVSPSQIIQPGMSFCELVPETAKLVVEVLIPARDIGYVRPGQPVLMKFAGYDYTKFGGMTSELDQVTAISERGPHGELYYKGQVFLPQRSLQNSQGEWPLKPGMILEAEIRTGSKTLTEYLLKPIFSSAREALRER